MCRALWVGSQLFGGLVPAMDQKSSRTLKGDGSLFCWLPRSLFPKPRRSRLRRSSTFRGRHTYPVSVSTNRHRRPCVGGANGWPLHRRQRRSTAPTRPVPVERCGLSAPQSSGQSSVHRHGAGGAVQSDATERRTTPGFRTVFRKSREFCAAEPGTNGDGAKMVHFLLLKSHAR